MGRYYSGDINGKFWFAVQSSTDGEFFGAEEQEHGTIPYCADDLEKAETGIMNCLNELGEYKKKLDDFFEKNNGYTDERLAEAIGVTVEEAKGLLVWYARLELGEKIAECIKMHGNCYFDAEI